MDSSIFALFGSLMESNRDHVKSDMAEDKHEVMPNVSVYEQYQKRMEQWEHALEQKDQETTYLHERLDEVQGELERALDGHASALSRCEVLTKQQETLAEQYDTEKATKYEFNNVVLHEFLHVNPSRQLEMDLIREEFDQRPPLAIHSDADTQTVDQ